MLSLSGCSGNSTEASLDELAATVDLESFDEVSPETSGATSGGGEAVTSIPAVVGEMLDLEKDTLKFGFIKLTDCAPIVIAKEKGFFEAEGLQVDVEAPKDAERHLDQGE